MKVHAVPLHPRFAAVPLPSELGEDLSDLHPPPQPLEPRAMSDTPESAAKPDWRSTVFLPKTDFPMKAGLPAKEPGILA